MKTTILVLLLAISTALTAQEWNGEYFKSGSVEELKSYLGEVRNRECQGNNGMIYIEVAYDQCELVYNYRNNKLESVSILPRTIEYQKEFISDWTNVEDSYYVRGTIVKEVGIETDIDGMYCFIIWIKR